MQILPKRKVDLLRLGGEVCSEGEARFAAATGQLSLQKWNLDVDERRRGVDVYELRGGTNHLALSDLCASAINFIRLIPRIRPGWRRVLSRPIQIQPL